MYSFQSIFKGIVFKSLLLPFVLYLNNILLLKGSASAMLLQMRSCAFVFVSPVLAKDIAYRLLPMLPLQVFHCL